MNDMKVTVKGWVASDPVKQVSKSGISYANFRIATTPRYKNAEGVWEDGKTEWITSCVFKEPFLSNITQSIKKGDPVVAVGSLYTNDFVKDDKTVSKNLELRLDTIGHDLTLGTANFKRATQSASIESKYDEAVGASDDKAKTKKAA